MKWLLAGLGAIVLVAVVGAGVATTRGESTEAKPASSRTRVEPAPRPAIKLTVVAPTEGATVRAGRSHRAGHGQPANAQVQVLGSPADVSDGVFSARTSLEMGDNSVDVVATAPNAEPVTTTVSVTRGRTQAQIAAAAARKRKARQRAAERKRRAAARKRAKANAPVAVPNLVGERLDVAEDDLRSRGLTYTEIGGTFGVISPSNWTVCETRPAPGTQVKKRSRVKLIVDRVC